MSAANPRAYGQGRLLCTRCGAAKRPHEFKPGKGMCRPCLRDRIREREAEHKMASEKQAIKRFASSLSGSRIQVAHVSEIAAEMMKKFGGVEAFCQRWMDQIIHAEKDHPGKKTVLDAFYRIVQLHVASTEHRDSAPDIADMTPEQIEIELRDAAVRALTANPEMLRELVNHLGYEMVPGPGQILIEGTTAEQADVDGAAR